MYLCASVCRFACVCMCVYLCMCVWVWVWVYLYVYITVHIMTIYPTLHKYTLKYITINLVILSAMHML